MHDLRDQRARRAAESLMENESLTEGLDAEAANTLLKWGIERAENIALDTDVLNEDQAQAAMLPRLRALRQMMSSISTLFCYQASLDATARAELLEQVLTQARTVYGPDFNAPDAARLASLLQAPFHSPEAWIETLRALLENKTANV